MFSVDEHTSPGLSLWQVLTFWVAHTHSVQRPARAKTRGRLTAASAAELIGRQAVTKKVVLSLLIPYTSGRWPVLDLHIPICCQNHSLRLQVATARNSLPKLIHGQDARCRDSDTASAASHKLARDRPGEANKKENYSPPLPLPGPLWAYSDLGQLFCRSALLISKEPYPS